MNLPTAVASGPSAETPDAVRPVRVAIGAGVLAALYLLVLYLAHPVPTRLLSLYGGAKNDVERHGGLEMIWLPPQGMSEQEVLARFHVGEHAAQVRRDRDAFVIGVPGVREEEVQATAKRLGGEEGLEFHRVLRVDEMTNLIRLLGLPGKNAKPVDFDVDQWRPDEGGETKTDYYLIGPTQQDVDNKFREARDKGWRLPPGAKIAYEHFETPKGNFWRSYVIDERAELDGGDIANATGSYDPNTNRPLVLLDFTREGGRKFGDLTSQIVGEKLATMLGDQIYSAPIINGAIRGGRASITMGGSDPAKQERERDALVATLKAGALPTGGTMMSAHYVAPFSDGVQQWLARVTVALLGGGLIGLFVWIVVRTTRPVRRRATAKPSGHVPWSRVGVTLLAPVALYALSQVAVIGVSEDELLYAYGGSMFKVNTFEHILSQVSFGALGIGPVISAFIFVEILALIFPGWRRRRHAGPVARRPLTTAVVITAATLLVVQSWFIVQYMYGLNRSGAEVIGEDGVTQWLVIGSFATGTLVLVGVAELIRRFGVGNGYGVLLASAWLIQVGGRMAEYKATLGANLIAAIVMMLAIAIPIATVARWRIARVGEAPLRVPSSGVVPLSDIGGLYALLGIIATFSSGEWTAKIYDWMIGAHEHHVLLIVLAAALTLLWSYAFARPNVTRKLAERVGLTAPSWRSWWAATGLSAAVLVLVGAVTTFTMLFNPGAAPDAITIALVTMVVLDAYDDTRARRVILDRAWTLHQPQYVDLVGKALDDAAIPHHFTSTNLRTLFAFFGPFAAIDVLVPPEHVPAAHQRIAELFE